MEAGCAPHALNMATIAIRINGVDASPETLPNFRPAKSRKG
jgi:hypothetical protein